MRLMRWISVPIYLQQIVLLLAEDQLGITLAVNAKAKTLTISDNGIGLSHDDLISSLGTIARSGSKAFVEQLAQSADTSDKKSG